MELTVPTENSIPIQAPYERLLEDENVTITDRSNGEVTPFSEIEKYPSHTATGNLTGFGIEIRDPSHEHGWRPVATVSDRYLLVNNREVVDVADRVIDKTGFDRLPRKIFFDGRRFVYSVVFPDVQKALGNDDVISLGVQFRNSYDASMKFRAEMYAERQVCVNGMVSKELFASHTFQHTIGHEGWQDEVEQALSILRSGPERLEQFVRLLDQSRNYVLSQGDLNSLRNGPLSSLPVTRWGEIVDEYLSSGYNNYTAYDLLNASSQVLWHRDRSVQDLAYNATCTDAITDLVNRDVTLN